MPLGESPTKASLSPNGDHVGLENAGTAEVTILRPLPSALMMKTARAPWPARITSNAICFPSGEYSGFAATMPSGVRRLGLAPLASAVQISPPAAFGCLRTQMKRLLPG